MPRTPFAAADKLRGAASSVLAPLGPALAIGTRGILKEALSGLAITSAIPPVFEAYATLEHPGSDLGSGPMMSGPYEQWVSQEAAIVDVLKEHTPTQPWWLGYLETGVDDVVFPDAPRVKLYAGWSLVAAPRSATGGKIERLLPSGQPDESFGRGGSVDLRGVKGLIEFLAPAGRGRILVGVTEAPAKRLTLFRLLPNGHLDRSFAKDGRGSYSVASNLEMQIVVGRRGSILVLGSLCCEGFRPVYRISPKGKLDTKFDAAARGALQRLDAFAVAEPTTLVPRPDGGVDVLGNSGDIYLNPKTAQGFELRLGADGRLDKGFGEGGARSLPLPIKAASPGVGGGTIAVAQVEETLTVLRLLADGAPDPAFGGGSGIQVPQPGQGVTPQPLAGSRVGLFGDGFRLCNQPTCVNAPYLARFIEASPSRPVSRKGGRG